MRRRGEAAVSKAQSKGLRCAASSQHAQLVDPINQARQSGTGLDADIISQASHPCFTVGSSSHVRRLTGLHFEYLE